MPRRLQMGAVRVFGNAYVSKGPPWGRRGGGLRLGRLGYAPGTLPPQLEPYLFTTEPRQCATETAKLSGASRVMAMNVCIARVKRGRKAR